MTGRVVTHASRTVHVEECMGTVFTIDVRDPGRWDAAIAVVVAWLRRVDRIFSTYRVDSDLSRIRRGELPMADADARVGEVLSLCEALEQETDGFFSADWRAATDGTGIDPTGAVKGWAIEEASRILRSRGSGHHAVNGGGDLQVAGGSAPGRPWRIGICDPFDPTQILTIVNGRDLAVATSGTAERGAHIIDPVTATRAQHLASVTVVGPSLTRADAYATAAFARGTTALAWLEELPGHEGFVVSADRHTACTSGFRALTETPAPGTAD